MRYHLNKITPGGLGENVFKTFLTITKITHFYKQLLKDWIAVADNQSAPPSTRSEILFEPIFSNQFFTTIHPDTGKKKLQSIPPWDKNSTTGSLDLVRDLCYEVIPAFLRMDQVQDAANFPVPNAITSECFVWTY